MLQCAYCLAAFWTIEGLAAHPCIGYFPEGGGPHAHPFDSDPDRRFRKFMNADTRAPGRDDDLGKLEGMLEEEEE